MTSSAVARFASKRLSDLYATRGENVSFRGDLVTAIVSPPDATFGIVEGGVEVEVECVVRFRISDFPVEPAKWEPVAISGRSKPVVIGAVKRDDSAGEFICRMVQAGGKP